MRAAITPGTELIPGYVLVQRLGAGGYGEVWKAQTPDDRFIALKVVELVNQCGDEELSAMELLSGIRHPHLLHIIGHWVSDQFLMIATELADCTAKDLAQKYRDEGFEGIPRDQLIPIMAQAAEAVDYLNAPVHELGGRKVSIQHRDLKPDNVFLTGQHVQVGDFGLVKVLSKLSEAHSGKGTMLYAPPETVDGELRQTSDQYSLALTYCWLLTHELPFRGSTPLEKLWSRVNEPPILDAYPSSDWPVLARALAIDPNDRFPSCAAFVRELDRPSRAALAVGPAAEEVGEPLLSFDHISTVEVSSSQEEHTVIPAGFIAATGADIDESGYPREIVCELDGSEMVLVPGGEFLYGPRFPNGNYRRVYLTSFYMDKYPVTNAQMQWFCRSADYTRADRWEGGEDGKGLLNRSSHSVVWISWDDAMAYCQWCGKILPTEAQWEKAARGTDGRRFPWGNALPTGNGPRLCNYGVGKTAIGDRLASVGSFPSGISPYGCHDLAGNVWEWCLDWYAAELGLRLYRDPQGPVSGKHRALRGGSWHNGQDAVETTFRNHLAPQWRGPTIGFRGCLPLLS